MSEVIEKDSEKKPEKRSTVAVNLPAIPMSVHRKIMKWRLKRSAEVGKQLSSMDAYADYLKESTRNLTV